MSNFHRIIIAAALGVSTVIGLQWAAINWFGVTQEQISGAGGIGLILAGTVAMIEFLKITEKRNKEN